MRGHRSLLAAFATTAALAVAGCTTTDGRPVPADPSGQPRTLALARLIAYDSCQQAMAGLRRAALGVVGAYGFGGSAYRGGLTPGRVSVPAAAADSGAAASRAAAPEHSGTNVQEPGVDEPDLVKTDGRRIVTVARGTLRVVDAASRRLTGTLPLPYGGPPWPYAPGADLLLSGDRLLVLVRGPAPYPVPIEGGGPVSAPQPVGPDFRLLLVDLAGPPRLLAALTVDGVYVDARQVGGIVRLVVESGPRLRFVYPDGRRTLSSAAAENRRVVQRSTPADWLPRYTVDRAGQTTAGQVPCDRLSHPASFTGSSLLTVYTFDLAGAVQHTMDDDPVSIVADGETVYGTARSLYVAHQAWQRDGQHTVIHRFDLAGSGRPRYAASGEVPGALIGQYALSEYDGLLRIATTTDRSAVRILQQRGGALVEVGLLDGLGSGERIYAVRFAGPLGYVVTFRQTDPLYTVDLRDPRRPRLAGELKIRGYSAYLHPVGGGRLVGVGESATGQGQRLGAQVSLFDVSDPARPSRLAARQVPGGYSVAETDPHAFLYWPGTGLLVVPVAVPGARSYAAGALVLSVRGHDLADQGTIVHPVTGSASVQNGVSRALVVGDTLWTLSDGGLLANDAGSLARQAWLPFS